MMIRIEVDTEDAEEIARALSVDNVDLPKGMEIKVEWREGKVIVSIEMQGVESILTLRNTADEILTHIDALMKVFNRDRESLRS